MVSGDALLGCTVRCGIYVYVNALVCQLQLASKDEDFYSAGTTPAIVHERRAMISLEQALRQRVLILNASPRNPAWSKLPASAWGGSIFQESPNLNVTRPDLVLEWCIELLNAGADVLDTLSFGADPFTAEESYGAGRPLRQEWNRATVSIARQAAAGRKFIIGAVGPTVDLFINNPRHSFQEHVLAFTEQVSDLWTAGVDAIHLEFCLDAKALKAALCAVADVEDRLGCRVPTIVTFDLDPAGTIMSGERPEELWEDLRGYKPIALGLATYGYGQDTVRRLREVTEVPLGILLDPFPRTPFSENEPIDWLAECLQPLLDERLLSFCGLSCTVPSIEYVRKVGSLIQKTTRQGL